MTSSQNVRALYRALLRAAKEWPHDPKKPERSFRDQAYGQIVSRFRQNSSVSDSATVDRLLAHGWQEHRSLQKLLNNYFLEKYPRSHAGASHVEQQKAARASGESSARLNTGWMVKATNTVKP